MRLSIDFDVFFNERIADEMLGRLQEWVGFSVNFSEYKVIEYNSGNCSYLVKINTDSAIGSEMEIEKKVIEALWKNLKIPLVAYGSYKDDCVRWAADSNGISSVSI
ncbi:hypothetical protein [Methylomonas sp. AM2-LC]|uniref:hypothetical protein n=1 Tax=Methylomonas sp. AM2-LC TaxID=3153301 RepID=UPI0032640874